ncbi:MAG: site-specific integrase [Verrucomicrobiota bacterium]
MKVALPKKFPHEVRKRNSVVRIYYHQRADRHEFKVAYYTADGTRKTETFSGSEDKFAVALKRAGEINDSVCNGELETLAISRDQHLILTRATKALKPTGLALDTATLMLADALKKLKGRTLTEAVDFLLARNPANLQHKPVAQVVNEMLAAKKADGVSAIYLKDLDYRLTKFGQAFQKNPSDISTAEVNTWLRELKCTGRSRNNYRNAIRSFFSYAISQRYATRDQINFDEVAMAKESHPEIEIFSPSELCKLLTAATFRPVSGLAGTELPSFCFSHPIGARFRQSVLSAIDVDARVLQREGQRDCPCADLDIH